MRKMNIHQEENIDFSRSAFGQIRLIFRDLKDFLHYIENIVLPII